MLKKLISFTVFITTVMSLYSQSKIEFEMKEMDAEGKIIFCKPKSLLQDNEQNQTTILKSIIIDNRLDIKLKKSIKDGEFKHHQYLFYFNNLEIAGADYVVHSTNNTISFANGNLPILQSKILTSTSIKTNEIVEKLLQKIKVSKTALQNDKLIATGESKLCYYYKNKELTLCYKVALQGNNITLVGNYFINAINAEIIYFEPSICTGVTSHTDIKTSTKEKTKVMPPPFVPGTAQTRYSGTRNIITDQVGTQFRLQDNRNGVLIRTLNANNQLNPETIINTATDFWDNDNNWTIAELGNDRYATDVHWASEQIMDYWQQVHNRNGINDAGMVTNNYIHTFIPSQFPEFVNVNAFWQPGFNAMFYGDGNPLSTAGPMGTFDITSHEIGHGICQFTSGLIGGSAESGALNEGFSDIWGATIEAWADPTKQRWLMGEEVLLPNLRNLANPNDPNSFEQRNGTGSHPDTYLQQFWQADGEPHFNSTVLSHWFFLLSEGGNNTNDLGNAYIVNAISINNAARIAYRTERFLPSNAGYFQARATSIDAARFLFGIGSCEEIAVTRAWFAVGVGADYNGNFPTIIGDIIGNDLFCTNSTYTFTGTIPTGATVTWSSSNNTIASVTGSGINTTATGISNGNFDIIITITPPTNSCFNQPTFQFVKSVIIGNPSNLNIFLTPSGTSLCTGTSFTAESYLDGATTYTWTPPTGLNISSGQGTFQINANVTSIPLGGQLTVSATNSCGVVLGSSDVIPTPQFPPLPKGQSNYITLTSALCLSNIFQAQVLPVLNATSYSWRVREFDVNGNLILISPLFTTSTNTSPTYNITANTRSARVLVYATTQCGNTTIINELFNKCKFARLANPTTEETITVNPNPTKGITKISLPKDFGQNGTYELSSSLSGLVLKGRITNNRNYFEIDLTKFSNGIYTLTFTDSKIIKQVKIIKE